MDAELTEYLERKFGQIDQRFAAIDSKIDALAQTMSTEVGALHSEIRGIDARLRREASLSTTLMDLTVKQSRWHEETDNAIADSLARQTGFSHKLAEMPALIDNLRGRVEKLEQRAS